MKMELLKFSKEVKDLIYAVIVLAIVFGFNDSNASFVFSDWLSNFLSVLLLVAIVFLTFFVGMKVASRLFNYEVEFSIWRLKKYFFTKYAHFPMELKLLKKKLFEIKSLHFGVIFSFFLMLISNGTIFFTSIFTFLVKDKRKFGKFRPDLKDSTEMGITIISLIFVVLLIVVFKILNIPEGVFIASWFLIWNLIPIGPLLGSKIFFASRIIYFWILVFMVLFLSIISVIPWFLSLVIALLFSLIAMIVYFVKVEY